MTGPAAAACSGGAGVTAEATPPGGSTERSAVMRSWGGSPAGQADELLADAHLSGSMSCRLLTVAQRLRSPGRGTARAGRGAAQLAAYGVALHAAGVGGGVEDAVATGYRADPAQGPGRA